MSQGMTRRSVLKTLGAGTVVLLGVSPTRAAAPGDQCRGANSDNRA